MRNHWKTFYTCVIKAFYQLYYLLVRYLPYNKLYQPLYGSADDGQGGVVRSCEDRWDAMRSHLEKHLAACGGKGSFLDIGCNIGYFSFSAAEMGYYSQGAEANPIYISTCNAIKATQKTGEAHFLKTWITPEFIKSMPSYDAAINLSVFHHWVKAYGEDVAKEMMKDLAKKCSLLVFETGQPDELGTKWAEKMGFIGDDPEKWGAEFLKEIGFAHVDVLGLFATGLTDVKRYLFVARKK